MPFKRRFPHVRHSRYEELLWTEKPYVHRILIRNGHLEPFPAAQTTKWRRQAGVGASKSVLILPQLNGRNDPVSIALLVDGLLNIETDQYINAGNLTNRLKLAYPHINWNPVTVGWILAGLAELADQVNEDDGNHPINRLQYGGARQYVINPTITAWQWLGALREYFGDAAEQAIAYAQRTGDYQPNSTAVWEDAA